VDERAKLPAPFFDALEDYLEDWRVDMALTKEESRKLEETHDAVMQVKTVLLGANGDDGLVGEVKRVTRSHYNLKRVVWILIGFLAGAGILTTSVLANIGLP